MGYNLGKHIFVYKMTAKLIPFDGLGLHERATAQLRTMLVEGKIAPGCKLNERELAQSLSVSRTPLREAIKSLAAEGLVELIPNRGAVAVALTEADVLQTFEVMAGLEGLSGEMAATRITQAQLTEIKALHFEMLAAYTRRDLSTYYRCNAKIHYAVNQAAQNPVLTQIYSQVNARLQALRFRTNQDEKKWRAAVAEHEQLIAALEKHDAQATRAVLITHLHNKRDAVLAQLRQTSKIADQVS
jgi:DNA-binding GntR family transcriptional regulator